MIDYNQSSCSYHVICMIISQIWYIVYWSSTGSCWLCTGSGIWCGCLATFKIHVARWEVTGKEHGSILGIYTLRYLNDTLSTSPFGQKESIGILSKYLKYKSTCMQILGLCQYSVRRMCGFATQVLVRMWRGATTERKTSETQWCTVLDMQGWNGVYCLDWYPWGLREQERRKGIAGSIEGL